MGASDPEAFPRPGGPIVITRYNSKLGRGMAEKNVGASLSDRLAILSPGGGRVGAYGGVPRRFQGLGLTPPSHPHTPQVRFLMKRFTQGICNTASCQIGPLLKRFLSHASRAPHLFPTLACAPAHRGSDPPSSRFPNLRC